MSKMTWIGLAWAIGCGGEQERPSSASTSTSTTASTSPSTSRGDYWQGVRDGEVDRRLPGPIYFAEGSDALDDAATGVVDEAARVLAERTAITRVSLQGWADGGEGDEEGREALGARRAEAVKAALVAKGIDAARLEAGAGPGIVSPHAPTDENSRASHRKVTLGVIEPRR